MKSNLSEIGEELKSILTGKTLDALILPLVLHSQMQLLG